MGGNGCFRSCLWDCLPWKGRKDSSKFIYLDEIGAFHGAGKSILTYQHFARIPRDAFIADCAARLRSVAPDADLWAFRTKHVAFLLLTIRTA
jgi:hypothetical protein